MNKALKCPFCGGEPMMRTSYLPSAQYKRRDERKDDE